jgi:23S rRNA (adenine2503-C2)-methyltransferase
VKIIASAGRHDIAVVYIGELTDARRVEFVEAVQPPAPREDKWILLVSTMCGCPVGCKMCDAGGSFRGNLSQQDIFEQIDALIRMRFPDGRVPVRQFKIQFARMGEPALNPEVLDVVEELPSRYRVPGIMPSISTIAPEGTDGFFERLLAIKKELFSGGRFQLQFSIHSTDESRRRDLIPVETWDFSHMAEYGKRFYEAGDRKVTLNFALAENSPLDPDVLLNHFNPDRFLVKITPLNPTYRAREHGLLSSIDPARAGDKHDILIRLKNAGYTVILSLGELEESLIGSNCGQYLRRHLEEAERLADGYTYRLIKRRIKMPIIRLEKGGCA